MATKRKESVTIVNLRHQIVVLQSKVKQLQSDKDYYEKRATRLEGEFILDWEKGYYKIFSVGQSTDLATQLRLGDKVRFVGQVTSASMSINHETKQTRSDIEVELLGVKKEL
jgi:hypothetical protein